MQEMGEKNQKNVLVLTIIAFESGTIYSHYTEKDTGHCQSICYERYIRFNISLGKVFS